MLGPANHKKAQQPELFLSDFSNLQNLKRYKQFLLTKNNYNRLRLLTYGP
jgi:hypothetical protein